jgi:hypothetical protein
VPSAPPRVREFHGMKARELNKKPNRRQAPASTQDKERTLVSFIRLPPVDCVIKRVLPAKCKVYNIAGRPIRA